MRIYNISFEEDEAPTEQDKGILFAMEKVSASLQSGPNISKHNKPDSAPRQGYDTMVHAPRYQLPVAVQFHCNRSRSSPKLSNLKPWH